MPVASRAGPLAVLVYLTLVARPASAQDAAQPDTQVGHLTISGFVQADAIVSGHSSASATGGVSSEPPDTFAIPRARIGVSGALTSRISWYLVGDFANVANDARVVRDAYVQFKVSPQVAVKFGQMVAPFSLERLTGYQKLELIDRSVVGTSLVPSRDMGLVVFNPTPWRGWITYGAAIINGTGQNRADDNDAKDVLGRIATRVPHVAHLTVGVNAQTGEQPQGRRHRVGVDLNYEARAYRLAIERILQRRDFATRIDTTGFTIIGAYKHPAKQVRPHYAGYELAARYVDVEDDGALLETHQVQTGGTYFITPVLRVQSNVVLPIGDDQPRHNVRWWSRLQINF